MTELNLIDIQLSAADLGAESTVPPVMILQGLQKASRGRLPEDSGLYLGYGFVGGSFPYLYQDRYTRELTNRTFKAVVLENDYLKAVFLPQLGGRMWSLFDKVAQKDLVFENPCVRYGNLSTRSAWFAGGVEFNFGPIGHHPHTCEQIGCATLKLDDGTPVLRLYEYERLREMPYQVDIFLPEASRVLLVRGRIVNDTASIKPCYWWSNIAVPHKDGARIITPSDSAYGKTDADEAFRISVPMHDGVDISYAENTKYSSDYFFNIPDKAPKFEAHIDADGYGLLHSSTARLKGRKLFVWGAVPGSARWQEFLSAGKGVGYYDEIQAGLARTQYECLPMPPFTAWEWVESYGAINAEAGIVHGEWQAAKAHVTRLRDEAASEEYLDKILQDTHAMAVRPADKVLCYGSGWGTVENMRRAKAHEEKMAPHLDFGPLSKGLEYWLHFLETGVFDEVESVPSYMSQIEWTQSLQNAAPSWQTHLHLGLIAIANMDNATARKELDLSLNMHENKEALMALAVMYSQSQNKQKACSYALCAVKCARGEESYLMCGIETLHKMEHYEELIALCTEYGDKCNTPRALQLMAYAYFYTGNEDKAEAILTEGDGLEIPNLREGEVSITKLWLAINEHRRSIGKEPVTKFSDDFYEFRLHPSD